MSTTCYRLGVIVAVLYVALAIAAPDAAELGMWPYVALVVAVLFYDRTGARRRG